MAAIAVFALSMSAQAQEENKLQRPMKKDKTEMVQHRTNEMVKQYGLNDKQAQQLQALNEKYADKMGPGRGHRHHGGRPDGFGDKKGRDFKDGKHHKGDSVRGQRPQMTDEQKAKMTQMRQERMAAMKEYDKELQTILTADQYKAYKDDMQKRGPRGPRGPRGDNPQQ